MWSRIPTIIITTGSRKAQGEGTRKAILEAAVHIASAEGLEGLTIGRLAADLSMSKSGLFAHFGSKEDLQVATVEAARSIFIREVIRPAFVGENGLMGLWRLCDTWLSYVESGVFRGGCFFAAVASELFNALELGANWAFQLYRDKQAFARARNAMLERLRRYATAKGSLLLPAMKKMGGRACR